MRKEDEAFVFATWLRGYRRSEFARRMDSKTFYDFHHQAIARIWGRPGARVWIAHPAGDEDTILGFSCLEATTRGPVLHYVFVKQAFERLGIGRALVAKEFDVSAPLDFTHWTRDAEPLARKFPAATYNPYLL